MNSKAQDYGDNPIAKRETGHYKKEYVQSFVEKWDELIDWDARAKGEGEFFIDELKKVVNTPELVMQEN